MALDVKTIGASGQISLGKQYAGRSVVIEPVEEGVWLIKTVRVIPENELWLHAPEVSQTLDRAIAWAEETPARESDLGKIEAKLKRRR